jgi:ABC-type multidrug transport system ATPase subunit
LYGIAVILCSYCLSFIFTQGSDAQLFITVIHFVSGWMFMIISYIMDASEGMADTNKILKSYLWRLFRASRLLGMWNNLFLTISKNQILPKLKNNSNRKTMEFKRSNAPLPGVLRYVDQDIEMTAIGAMTPSLEDNPDLDPGEVSVRLGQSFRDQSEGVALAGQLGAPVKAPINDPFIYDEDIDVAAERKRVVADHQDGKGGDALRIIGLRKWYPGKSGSLPKLAVRSLSLGVRSGECFGFLGTNGAGKTTTLKMLTGDITPTEGDAFVSKIGAENVSVIKQLRKAQSLIGYCPQFDALYPRMSAREHLHMYARIKGIEEHLVPIVTEQLLQTVTLEKFADKPAGTYSGGNKRKLSLCIALMGNPSLVLLDEPSSGMDPHARRAMWDVISASMGDGRSVMLTTHSMEECEALCSRVGIMVTGALRCVGTPQHLKDRFGEGYQIEMRVGEGSNQMAVDYITRNFGAKVTEVHGCRIRARMRMRRELSLSKIFAEMERQKESLGILNYSISQSSLEQVFMKIANEHNEFQRRNDTVDGPADEIDPIGDGSL